MNIKYQTIKIGEKKLVMIERINKIITEYAKKGFTSLTLRQVYYQFVARNWITNEKNSYRHVAAALDDGRLAGLVSWTAITDKTRNLQKNSSWESAREIVQDCEGWYQLDRWKNQDRRIEVWIEKDALLGVISGICSELDVPYFSCRGYTSQSEMWSAGMRLARHVGNNQDPLIIHLGDHDPSGIDMTRDVEARLSMFARGAVEVKRIALNRAQVDKYKCPENPAKLDDPRANGYIAEHGRHSWELDALDPELLVKLIKTEVLKHRDEKKLKLVLKEEEVNKEKLRDCAENAEELE